MAMRMACKIAKEAVMQRDRLLACGALQGMQSPGPPSRRQAVRHEDRGIVLTRIEDVLSAELVNGLQIGLATQRPKSALVGEVTSVAAAHVVCRDRRVLHGVFGPESWPPHQR